MTKQTEHVPYSIEEDAFYMFCYHRCWYIICIQFDYFFSRFQSIFGFGLLIILLCDVQLKYIKLNVEPGCAQHTEYVLEYGPLYREYVVKFWIAYLMHFVYFLCFLVLEFQAYINNLLPYFHDSSTHLNWTNSSHYFFLHRQIVCDKQIAALESCGKFPKLIMREIKVAAFPSKSQLKNRQLHVFSQNITIHDLQGKWVNSTEQIFEVTGVVCKNGDLIIETDDKFILNNWILKKNSKTLTWKLEHNDDVFWYRSSMLKPAFTMAWRIVIAALFIHLFRIFVNCCFDLFGKLSIVQNMFEFNSNTAIYYYTINVCNVSILLAYLLVLKFPHLV